ncbi:MAG TPA: hypothetical protein VES79_05220, partial [Solirubrobacteraceae bacterium]|nr:hypothetical protein [Solirubrobacteraceae bacterium]
GEVSSAELLEGLCRAGHMSTIWELTEPFNTEYFLGLVRGTWDHDREGCDTCGRVFARRVSPLLLEWETGAKGVGDFTFAGFGAGFAIVVGRDIIKVLEANSRACSVHLASSGGSK